MKRFSIVFAALIMLVCAGQLHAAIISNGSFESGISGWTNTLPLGASTTVLASHSEVLGGGGAYTPTDGSFFVLLKSDGPGSSNVLEQTFTAAAADVVSFDVFFDAGDYAPFNDLSTVDISTSSGSVNLWSVGVLDVGDYSYTPWTSISYTIPTTDTYTLKFKIHNALDSVQDSYMGIDNVVASGAKGVIPEPATFLIWSVLGVLGIAYGWRRRKTA